MGQYENARTDFTQALTVPLDDDLWRRQIREALEKVSSKKLGAHPLKNLGQEHLDKSSSTKLSQDIEIIKEKGKNYYNR